MSRLLEYPLTDLSDCATGHHTWQPTRYVGKAVCVICGMIGYCLFCAGGDIPSGAPLRPCRHHRHTPAPLADSILPLSAFSKGDAI